MINLNSPQIQRVLLARFIAPEKMITDAVRNEQKRILKVSLGHELSVELIDGLSLRINKKEWLKKYGNYSGRVFRAIEFYGQDTVKVSTHGWYVLAYDVLSYYLHQTHGMGTYNGRRWHHPGTMSYAFVEHHLHTQGYITSAPNVEKMQLKGVFNKPVIANKMPVGNSHDNHEINAGGSETQSALETEPILAI